MPWAIIPSQSLFQKILITLYLNAITTTVTIDTERSKQQYQRMVNREYSSFLDL